jgi:hypothetical protein
MARSQIDPPSRSIEEMLAEANAAALANKPTLQFCPRSLIAKMSEIDSMGEKELRKLVKQCNQGMLAVMAMSAKERSEAIKDGLALIALLHPDIRERVMASDKYLDRAEGKPAQTINGNVDVNVSLAVMLDKAELMLKHRGILLEHRNGDTIS